MLSVAFCFIIVLGRHLMLSVAMLSVAFFYCYAECRYAVCRYGDYHCAKFVIFPLQC
jgi:hypothetical protein